MQSACVCKLLTTYCAYVLFKIFLWISLHYWFKFAHYCLIQLFCFIMCNNILRENNSVFPWSVLKIESCWVDTVWENEVTFLLWTLTCSRSVSCWLRLISAGILSLFFPSPSDPKSEKKKPPAKSLLFSVRSSDPYITQQCDPFKTNELFLTKWVLTTASTPAPRPNKTRQNVGVFWSQTSMRNIGPTGSIGQVEHGNCTERNLWLFALRQQVKP